MVLRVITAFSSLLAELVTSSSPELYFEVECAASGCCGKVTLEPNAREPPMSSGSGWKGNTASAKRDNVGLQFEELGGVLLQLTRRV